MQVEQHAAPGSDPGGRPPSGLRANANPFAGRRPEQLNRQVGIGVRHHVLERPCDAVGPVGRPENRGERAGAVGLGVTLARAPLIKARPGFGKKLVAPFAFEPAHSETIYLVSRTELARDRRIAAVRRWIAEAVGRAS